MELWEEADSPYYETKYKAKYKAEKKKNYFTLEEIKYDVKLTTYQ